MALVIYAIIIFYLLIADLPHDMDYPYPIHILAFLSDTAVLRFDTMCQQIIFICIRNKKVELNVNDF